MAEVSNRFSLREVVGTVAPGAMVLLAVIYVVSRIPGVGGPSRIESGWSALAIVFVVSYGVGTLLTSLTEAVFAAVTKLNTTSPLAPDLVARPATTPAERVYQGVDRFVKHAVGYLGGGQDITTGIREFRESWHERAVPEGVISSHSMALARRHYEALFDTEPKGEEALFVCEYYIRERMPMAMQEIEQNAAKAALLGNLIIPMLTWMIAAFAGIFLTLVNEGNILSTLMQLVVFGALVVLFPYVLRMIGRQWTEASRARVKIVLLAFIIACRLTRQADAIPAPAMAAAV